MLIDLKPLIKYRDFRLIYLGQFISFFGGMLTYVALPYQVYQITHSTLAVGNIGLVELIPLLITSLWGGVLADKFDRRKLLLLAECGLILTSALLLFNSLPGQQHLWVIFLVAALASGLDGFHRPALDALGQKLVEPEDMPAFSALMTFRFSVGMIGGPALAGILLAKSGLTVVYFLDFLSFFISLIAIYFLRTRFVPEKTTTSILQSIKEGLSYAKNRQELLGTYVVDFFAMVFGMPMALFPAIAEKFHSVSAIGWLYAGPSIGMLLASVFSGWTDKIQRHGKAISISASVWGLAIIAFGLTHNLYVAVLFLAIAGAGDAVSGLFRMTLWNQTIPQNYRGRLAGIEMISYMSGPLLGNAEAGFVAHMFNVQFSVISGGILCVLCVAFFAWRMPGFWNYKKSTAS